jgi:hypothetical protein
MRHRRRRRRTRRWRSRADRTAVPLRLSPPDRMGPHWRAGRARPPPARPARRAGPCARQPPVGSRRTPHCARRLHGEHRHRGPARLVQECLACGSLEMASVNMRRMSRTGPGRQGQPAGEGYRKIRARLRREHGAQVSGNGSCGCCAARDCWRPASPWPPQATPARRHDHPGGAQSALGHRRDHGLDPDRRLGVGVRPVRHRRRAPPGRGRLTATEPAAAVQRACGLSEVSDGKPLRVK